MARILFMSDRSRILTGVHETHLWTRASLSASSYYHTALTRLIIACTNQPVADGSKLSLVLPTDSNQLGLVQSGILAAAGQELLVGPLLHDPPIMHN